MRIFPSKIGEYKYGLVRQKRVVQSVHSNVQDVVEQEIKRKQVLKEK